jgi:hypothetical protein
MNSFSASPLKTAAGDQLARVKRAISEIEAEAPPEHSARGKLLRSLRMKHAELERGLRPER